MTISPRDLVWVSRRVLAYPEPVRVARLVLRKAVNLQRVLEYVQENCNAVVMTHRPTEHFDDEFIARGFPGWTLKETVYIGGKRIRTIEAPRDGRRAETRGGQDANRSS